MHLNPSQPRKLTSIDYPWLILVSLTLLFTAAFLVRLWGLSYLHSWDEMVYLQNAKVICCHKTNYSELDFRPPLLSLVYAAVFLIRDHIFAASIVTAALNALAPIFLFLAGRGIVGKLPAALAALLLAFAPFFVGTFPETFDSDATGNSLLTDCPALTLILLSLWLMLRGLGSEKLRSFALAGFALSLTILMRFGSIPSAALLCLLPLLASQRLKSLLATATGLAIGLLPYLFWSWRTYGSFLYTLSTGWKNVEGPSPPATFYFTNAPAVFTWLGVIGLLTAAILAFMHIIRLPEFHRIQFSATHQTVRVFLWLWLLAGAVFFSTMPHKEPRYILPLVPPVLLLSGAGLARLCSLPGKMKPIGATLLALAMLATFYPTAEHLTDHFFSTEHSEEREASLYLNSKYPASTLLYSNFNYPAFAYFTSFPIKVLPIDGPELYQSIDTMPRGSLLIAYRQSESNEPRLDYLDQDPNLQVAKQYSSLVIYRHR